MPDYLGPVSGDPATSCGRDYCRHRRDSHFRGTLSCLATRPDDAIWACACPRFIEKEKK